MQDINDPALNQEERELLACGRAEKNFKERAYKVIFLKYLMCEGHAQVVDSYPLVSGLGHY